MLNGKYTIFGQCDEAVGSAGETDRGHELAIAAMTSPYRPIKINHIAIQKGGGSATAAKRTGSTAAKKPARQQPRNSGSTPKYERS